MRLLGREPFLGVGGTGSVNYLEVHIERFRGIIADFGKKCSVILGILPMKKGYMSLVIPSGQV